MRLNKILLIGALTAALATLTNGCAYRADLDQGNFVEQDAVNKLRQGMTDAQVRFILGTPMLTDPLDNQRWYYTMLHREGWNDPEIHNLVAIFQGRTLVDIQGDFEKPAQFYSGVDSFQKIDSADMDAVEQPPVEIQGSADMDAAEQPPVEIQGASDL